MTDNKSPLRNTFAKNEKLCYQKSIDRLFAQGKSFIAYPLRVIYFVEKESEEAKQFPQILISVSKRKFKRANKRNRVKRLVREAYRMNKALYLELMKKEGLRMDIAFLYLKDELPSYGEIEKSILKTIAVLGEKIGEENH